MASSFAQGTRFDSAQLSAEILRFGSVTVDAIRFESATTTLRADSVPVLGEVLKMLDEHDEWRFEVQVHADDLESRDANLALSDRQAQAIVTWLVERHVSISRLVARGLGAGVRGEHRRVVLKKLNEE